MSEVRKYEHAVAAYPTKFKGCVVSPNKICIQFRDVQLKTRVHNRDYSDLTLDGTMYYMGVGHLGTDVGGIAVGVPLHLHPTMLEGLVEGYREHMATYDHFPTEPVKKAIKELLSLIEDFEERHADV